MSDLGLAKTEVNKRAIAREIEVHKSGLSPARTTRNENGKRVGRKFCGPDRSTTVNGDTD